MPINHYQLSRKLIRNVSEIERLYGRLESLRVPGKLLLNLERGNLVQSAYSSNRIEGNSLSKQDVTNLLLDARVPVNRDEKEVENYFNILKAMEGNINRKIDVTLILEMHGQLLSGVNEQIKGQIRNRSVVVGRKGEMGEIVIKHNPPAHSRDEIEQLLVDLSAWLNNSSDLPMLKAGLFHHHFVYIHPFEDGNGRVCRLLTALVLLQSKYLINKYFVLDDYYDIDRDLYSDKLHSADHGDKTEWLEYFTDGVKYSLKSALVKVENGLRELEYAIRPSKKEREALRVISTYREITSTDLALQLDVSRQQAFNLLKALAEKGFLEQIGEKKGTYYRFREDY